MAILNSIKTQNYKNLVGEIKLNKLNIFIGSNGSGKSNLINYIQFLKNCITPIWDPVRGVSSFEDAISILGGNRILDNTVASPAYILFNYSFSNLDSFSKLDRRDNDTVNLSLKLWVDQSLIKSRANLAEENLSCDRGLEQPFFYYKFHGEEIGKGLISIYDEEQRRTRFERLENIPINTLGVNIIPSLLENTSFTPKNTTVYEVRRELLESVADWQFYNANNMDLHQIRTSEPKIGSSDIHLSSSGENLPLVFENLIQQNIDFEDSINEAMKAILPKTRRIRPMRSGQYGITIEWYFEGIKEPFYLREMSDGTVRMLCWAVILHSPKLPSLLVIDEPELGLHVAWMRILAEWIKKASRNTQIIIATHSPDLLDNFTDCLENVLCFSSSDKIHFSTENLSREHLEEKLAEGWELGDLYRIGDPSIGGWPW
ncbi:MULTISPECIES: AAA family ATPase [Planktothricoides]|uniref:AAA family ATPase n=1 Tax=Planktothricoides raciborskii GIHE-MW2 TaxID=2792601 RepID=A0AAU8JJ41_9CYAN|nr:AAA family ATPase [Planktothricoides sp. SR001]KOR34587.1 ATPase [Planktothricoides sp. SR001]